MILALRSLFQLKVAYDAMTKLAPLSGWKLAFTAKIGYHFVTPYSLWWVSFDGVWPGM